MLFFFDRYPLVKLNFFFFVSHICLVLLQNGRKEMDKLVETTADQIRREMKIYIKHKQIFVVSNIAETVPLLLSFYAPLTETWLCMMERGQGRQGREYSGILFGQQKLNPKIYIFELRVDTGDLSACLVIFPRICQIIILMNYKAVIGTKAASTEWFPTLSKWSLWRGAERRYW